MLLRLLIVTVLVVLFCSPASAGKNAGGALVVHAADGINNTMFPPPDYCDVWTDLDFSRCEELDPQSDYVDPNFLLGEVIWVVVALPEDSSPGVSVVYFGIEHNFGPGFIAGWSLCGPQNSLEIPDAGWPDDWENAGNAVAFGSPIVDNRLFAFYWFGVYGDMGNHIGTGINPTGGYAALVSDDNPGVLDEVHLFGQARFLEPGYNQCPDGTLLACCFPDGLCEMLTPFDCDAAGGSVAEFDSCDPNPCPQTERVCCIAGECSLMTEDECLSGDGIWFPDEETCEGFECPPVAIEETTWGSIKVEFR